MGDEDQSLSNGVKSKGNSLRDKYRDRDAWSERIKMLREISINVKKRWEETSMPTPIDTLIRRYSGFYRRRPKYGQTLFVFLLENVSKYKMHCFESRYSRGIRTYLIPKMAWHGIPEWQHDDFLIWVGQRETIMRGREVKEPLVNWIYGQGVISRGGVPVDRQRQDTETLIKDKTQTDLEDLIKEIKAGS